jgi:hypothetical protein
VPRTEKWGSCGTVDWQNADYYGAFVSAASDDRLARERCRIRDDTKTVHQLFEPEFCLCVAYDETPIAYPDVLVKQRLGSGICVQDEPESIDRDRGLADGVQRIGGA